LKGVKDLSYAHFIDSSPELKDELSSSLLKKGSVILVPGFSATMETCQGNKKFFYFQDILIELAYIGGRKI